MAGLSYYPQKTRTTTGKERYQGHIVMVHYTVRLWLAAKSTDLDSGWEAVIERIPRTQSEAIPRGITAQFITGRSGFGSHAEAKAAGEVMWKEIFPRSELERTVGDGLKSERTVGDGLILMVMLGAAYALTRS